MIRRWAGREACGPQSASMAGDRRISRRAPPACGAEEGLAGRQPPETRPRRRRPNWSGLHGSADPATPASHGSDGTRSRRRRPWPQQGRFPRSGRGRGPWPRGWRRRQRSAPGPGGPQSRCKPASPRASPSAATAGSAGSQGGADPRLVTCDPGRNQRPATRDPGRLARPGQLSNALPCPDIYQDRGFNFFVVYNIREYIR